MEGMESQEPRRAELPGIPLGDYRVQIALARLWFAHEHPGESADNNTLMTKWLDSGFAEEYRTYVETDGRTITIDPNDPKALESTLETIGKRTIH